MNRRYALIWLVALATTAFGQNPRLSAQRSEDYAEAFMRLNNPPKEENDGDIIDSILIVVNGMRLPKSMNRQLIRPRPRNGEVVNWSSISLEEALKIPVEPDKKIDNRQNCFFKFRSFWNIGISCWRIIMKRC